MRILAVLGALLLAGSAVACRDGDNDPVTPSPQGGGTPSATATGDAPTSTPVPSPTSTAATVAPVVFQPGTHEHSLESGGRSRSYLVHVPPAAVGGMPLVMVLHGGGGNAMQVMRSTGFADVADEDGFIAVFPNGSGRLSDDFLLTWNSGNCCAYALAQGIDDVSFLRTVAEAVVGDYGADGARVFATGMSNGGMMSYRLACEASDIFLAVATVAGALNVDCAPDHPVSLLAIHGTDDRSVRYEGGAPLEQVDRTPRVDASVADSVEFFVAHNGCDEGPAVSVDGILRFNEWGSCGAGTRVALYSIEGGVHEWPGDRRATVARDIDASRLIWEFFATLQPR